MLAPLEFEPIALSSTGLARIAALSGAAVRGWYRATISARELWKAFQEWCERARVRAILSALSDRELKDLGFFRGEIESVVMDDAGKLILAFPEDNRH